MELKIFANKKFNLGLVIFLSTLWHIFFIFIYSQYFSRPKVIWSQHLKVQMITLVPSSSEYKIQGQKNKNTKNTESNKDNQGNQGNQENKKNKNSKDPFLALGNEKKQKISLQDLKFNPQNITANDKVYSSHNIKIGKFGDLTGIEQNAPEAHNSVYNAIYDYINSNMNYPSILRKKKIEGFVKVRVVFSKDGLYHPELTKIQSNSNYLKVFVSRKLKKLFERKISWNLSFISNDYLLIDATFRFNANLSNNDGFIKGNHYMDGRNMKFLIQNGAVAMVGFNSKEGLLLNTYLNLEDAQESFKTHFTTAGKLRKLFYEEQLEKYREDPAWQD